MVLGNCLQVSLPAWAGGLDHRMSRGPFQFHPFCHSLTNEIRPICSVWYQKPPRMETVKLFLSFTGSYQQLYNLTSSLFSETQYFISNLLYKTDINHLSLKNLFEIDLYLFLHFSEFLRGYQTKLAGRQLSRAGRQLSRAFPFAMSFLCNCTTCLLQSVSVFQMGK